MSASENQIVVYQTYGNIRGEDFKRFPFGKRKVNTIGQVFGIMVTALKE